MSLTPLPAFVAQANAEQARREVTDPKTLRAIAKYSRRVCLEAFKLHQVEGNGASTVGIYLGLTTRQADAAINAGRDITTHESL